MKGSPNIPVGKYRGVLFDEQATRPSIYRCMMEILPNPAPVLRRAGAMIEILREIGREPCVAGSTTNRKAGVVARLRKWHLYKGNASVRSTEVIGALLKGLPMRDIVRRMLNAWAYGYHVSEVVWQRIGDLLLPATIVDKPPEWFGFGWAGGELRRKSAGGRTAAVEPYKYLLLQADAEYNNPYGDAAYARYFWPVTMKRGGLKIWATFLDKYGMPHVYGTTPLGTKPEDRQRLLDTLSHLYKDAVAVFPDDVQVALREVTNVLDSGSVHERFARYHDGQICKAILGHDGAAGCGPDGESGALALTVRDDIVEDDCRMIEEAFNTLISWIYRINPRLGQNPPAFHIYDRQRKSAARWERDRRLIATGQIHLKRPYLTKHYYDDGEIAEL